MLGSTNLSLFAPPAGGSTGGGTASTTKPDEAAAVRVVFDHWQQAMGKPRAKLTADRARKVRARLREGYNVQEILQAVQGCAASPFHRGENDRGTEYVDLTLICRSGSKLEQFIEMAPEEPAEGTEAPVLRDGVYQEPERSGEVSDALQRAERRLRDKLGE